MKIQTQDDAIQLAEYIKERSANRLYYNLFKVNPKKIKPTDNAGKRFESLKKALRKQWAIYQRIFHPDNGRFPDEEVSKLINIAYDRLLDYNPYVETAQQEKQPPRPSPPQKPKVVVKNIKRSIPIHQLHGKSLIIIWAERQAIELQVVDILSGEEIVIDDVAKNIQYIIAVTVDKPKHIELDKKGNIYTSITIPSTTAANGGWVHLSVYHGNQRNILIVKGVKDEESLRFEGSGLNGGHLYVSVEVNDEQRT